jgi:hypothetical protein
MLITAVVPYSIWNMGFAILIIRAYRQKRCSESPHLFACRSIHPRAVAVDVVGGVSQTRAIAASGRRAGSRLPPAPHNRDPLHRGVWAREPAPSYAVMPLPRQSGIELAVDMQYLHLYRFSAKAPSMPLNIKDPATEKSVRELAALTGETVLAGSRYADPRRDSGL